MIAVQVKASLLDPDTAGQTGAGVPKVVDTTVHRAYSVVLAAMVKLVTATPVEVRLQPPKVKPLRVGVGLVSTVTVLPDV